MAEILSTRSIGYDDVNLIAQPAKIESRKSIPIEGGRIVVSAMTSIIGPDFIKAVAKLPFDLQPTLHIPRDKYALNNIALCYDLGLKKIFIGVGIDTPEIKNNAKALGYQNVLLDVANGYLPQVKEAVSRYYDDGFKVIVGSVHTLQGAYDLLEAGASIVRSGIGPGSVCITKDSTGFTRGTISEILELAQVKNAVSINPDKDSTKIIIENPYKDYAKVLADGGLRAPSDAVKAFLAGADFIMTGRMFVDAEEARMRKDGTDIYFGQASALGKAAMGNKVTNVEGKADKLSRANLQPLEQILTTIWDGIRSGVSYSGYATLTDAIGKGVFELKTGK